MTADDISRLRAAIDAIDDEIIARLDKRAAIVQEVGKIKYHTLTKGTCFVRAAREAELVRNIYKRFEDSAFPAHAAAVLWRMIISASLTIESALNISVSEADNTDIRWLAREYFGSFIPIVAHKKSNGVMEDLIHNRAQIGVLPLAKTEQWWCGLPKDIYIFACIPFILEPHQSIRALAVARLEPESTGHDVTLLKITADHKIDAVTIGDVFDPYRVKARLIQSVNNTHLVEIQGFIRRQDTLLEAIMREAEIVIEWLGAYALPLTLSREIS